ncbi:MAG: hypothetical protein OEU26_29130 [Candidatus Tectomicrobia bacterium]|nr:hypothetical protein [Candidatus Tectomicrobia bacterium]
MLSPSRYDEVRREIEAILDDPTLPRHLQVSFIIDLFDTQGGADIIDFWPDDGLTAREKTANETDDPSPPKKPARKKRAKTTKRRS